ncbi:MAG TPA: hypothetical protein VKV21_18530 [Solirubrobacteraceae bacterium]|nr:hypothetical protein [Solirubrobacteraceae bacterium]
MTPAAVTPAARTKRGEGSGTPRPGSPRSSTARPSAPAPRTKRPSSPHPSTPRPAHRAPRGKAAAPSAPRRVSGPVRTARVPQRPARTGPRGGPSLPRRVRALAFARTLPDHRLLDRLVRGRLWIPVLGVLLIGIVASQVAILKLNASLGHGVVRAAQLQAEDQRLAAEVSELSDVQRVESSAARMGLSMPAAYTPVFLSGGRGELRRALANIHRPDAASFEARAAALATHRAAEVQTSSGR